MLQGVVGSCPQRFTPFVSVYKPVACRKANSGVVKCSSNQASAGSTRGNYLEDFARAAAGLALAASVTLSPAVLPQQFAPQAEAILTAGDPVKNARALLRNALPIDNKYVRQIQNELEGISEQLRVPGSKPLGAIERAVKKSEGILNKEKQKIIADFAPDKKESGAAAIDSLFASLKDFEGVIASGDKQAIPAAQSAALMYVGQIEEAMVKGFPFTVPAEYAHLPQLKGRATVDMDIIFKEAREEGVTGGTMRIVLDGYNAPVSAGNFVDLVERGFYNNMEIQRADGFVVQFGDPDGPADGFVDPKSGTVRRVPFEVMVRGEKMPVYEDTLEDLGRPNDQPVLPFNAFGTMAVARAEFETNSGSSQMFFLLKESELTPTGANLLDGRYAVFGYIVDNYNLLKDIKVGDKIVKAEIISGADNLQKPSDN